MTEEGIDTKVKKILKELDLAGFFGRIAKAPPPGEINQVLYFESIGMFWRLIRNNEGLEPEDLSAKTGTDVTTIYLFELGMAPAEYVKELPKKYAAAMGKEVVHLRLYTEFLERQKIPKHIYEIE